jgi:hypothetical protein
MKPSIILLDKTFTIHRLGPAAEIPLPAMQAPFFAMIRTEDELSLVLPGTIQLASERSEPGWACLQVEGPLDFSQVGVLAGIASVLAEANVSIFALSTFDTDYILVKREQVRAAREALINADYDIKTN